MKYDALKKRLDTLIVKLSPGEKIVYIELPDGTREKKSAAEWWDNRHEWKLADFRHQDNSGGYVIFLVLAGMSDDEIETAKTAKDKEAVKRLTKERDELLKLYFDEDVRCFGDNEK